MDELLNVLRKSVKSRISERRYLHTLGVEDMATKLGEHFIPEMISELRAAALLHDVAKELDYQEQIKIISDQGILVSDEDIATLPAVHSFAACGVIKRDFPDYATPEILSAVYNHTLGAPDMSLFDKIIYIADYIEEGRCYSSSCEVRSYLLQALEDNLEDKMACINRAIVMSIDHTVKHLNATMAPINSKTLLTKSSLQTLN